jgi:hypothetical protein
MINCFTYRLLTESHCCFVCFPNFGRGHSKASFIPNLRQPMVSQALHRVPQFCSIPSREGDKKPARITTDSFSKCCIETIRKKYCCQMPGISLVSAPIAPCGAGANGFLP